MHNYVFSNLSWIAKWAYTVIGIGMLLASVRIIQSVGAGNSNMIALLNRNECPDVISIRILGQQTQVDCVDVSCADYFISALHEAEMYSGYQPSTLTYELQIGFADGSLGSCALSPYLNSDGLQIGIMTNYSDADLTRFAIKFKEPIPPTMFTIMQFLKSPAKGVHEF